MFNITALQGRRQYMEDTYLVQENLINGLSLYAVFDGHGGDIVARRCSENLQEILLENLQKTHFNIAISLTKTFIALDEMFDIAESYMTGTTCLVILRGHDNIWVANCGDSRVIINAGDSFEQLSFDHKPVAQEKKRIEEDGGTVMNVDGIWRVSGELAVSRAIGDKRLRPYVIPTPEITTYSLTPFNKFMILATDGLWDVMSNKRANAIVLEQYNNFAKGDKIVLDNAALRMKEIIEDVIFDNTTFILVHLRR